MDEILHSLRHRKQLLFKSFCLILFLTFNVFKSEAHLPKSTPFSHICKPPLPLTLITTVTLEEGSCGGESFIDVEVQNGEADYNFEIFLDGAPFNSFLDPVTNTLTNKFTKDVEFYKDYYNIAGTYEIKVTDKRDSVATSTFTLGFSLKLVEKRDIKCKLGLIPKLNTDLFKGGIEVMVINGVGPYIYTVNGTPMGEFSSPIFSLESLEADDYTITVIDVGTGCPSSAPITITILDFSGDALFATFTPKDILCGGTATGEIAIKTTGGKLPLTFILDKDTILPASNPTPPNFIYKDLRFGKHKVVVSDVNGCSITNADIEITQLPPLSISAKITNLRCNGVKDGQLEVSATGGTAPYKYSINGMDFYGPLVVGDPFTFFGLAAGLYTVTVKDANMNSCTATLSKTISEPNAITFSVVVTDVKCKGDATGQLIINATGGTGALQYSIKPSNGNATPFQPSNKFTGLSAEVYTVTVMDVNSCTASISEIFVTEPDVNVTIVPTNLKCNGIDDGQIEVNVVGANLPISYSLDGTKFISSNTFTGLSAISYTVTVMYDNVCMITAMQALTQPAPFSITSISQTNVLCKGSATGVISFLASGSTSTTYTYEIHKKNDIFFFFTSSLPIFDNLKADTYFIVAIDENGCSVTSNDIVITEPTGNPPMPTIISKITTSCDGLSASGEFTVTTTGGTFPITFSVDGGPEQSSTTTPPSFFVSNLPIGVHKIFSTDALGCKVTSYGPVFPTSPLGIILLSNLGNFCVGQTFGKITAFGNGGTRPYTYSKDGINFQMSEVFFNLATGDYTITVKDANGCTASGIQSIRGPLVGPSVSSVATDVLCKGGTTGQLVVTPTKTSGPITFSRDGVFYLESDVFYSISYSLTGLTAGVYTISVRDANGCTASSTQTISEPLTPLSITNIVPTNVKCKGDAIGQLEVIATGGTGTIVYSKDGTNYQPSNIFAGLIKGTYTITVRDANSCTAVLMQTITEPTTPLSITSIAPMNVKCKGDATGQLEVTATGGTGTIEYSKDGTNYQPSNIFIGLIKGTYTITVRDANSCTAVLMQTITEPTTPLSITSIAPTNVKCKGDATGQLEVTATGGTGTIEYSKDGTNYQPSNTFIGLIKGTYSITVRDANSCTAVLMQTITEPTKALSLALVSSTDIKCKGDLTGKIEVMAIGGTPNYTYEVNTTSFSTNIYESLIAGTYKIKVIDENGCMNMLNVTLNEPLAPLSIVSIPTIDVKCKGDATGKITVNPTGGTIAYSYSINGINFQPSNVFDNLFAKKYTVTLKDANGCIVTQDVEIKEPALKLSLALTNQINLDCIIRSGSATVTAAGGTGAYTYKLGSKTQTTATFTNVPVGDYVISVTDENSCIATVPLSIVDNKVNTSAPNALSNKTLCQSAQVDLSPMGSTGSYNFYDKNPSTNVGLTPLAINKPTYTFTPLVNTTIWITAVTGVCESTPIAVTVTILEPLKLTAIPTKPLCPNGMDGKIDLTITGGITPYIINWTGPNGFTSTNEDLTSLKAGAYNVEVKLNGFTCKETLQVVVPEGMDMTPPTIKTKNLTVYLDAQGKATVTAAQLDNGTTDNCLLQSIMIGKGAFTCGNVGLNTVVFTATDAYGNSTSSIVIVTVVDDIKPVIVCPAPIEVTLKALECSRKIDFAVTATDNCSAVITQTFGNPSGSLFEAGTHKLFYKATDPSGNTAECVVDIKVNEYKAGGALLCAGEINLSLGDLCINQVKPSTILLGGDYRCLNSYTVMLKDKNGRLVTDDYVRGIHIGTRMTISVVDPKTGSSCWGYANIEDKIAPVIQCPFDALVLCDDVEAGSSPLISLTGEPRLIYECSRTNTSYFDEFIETNCSETFTTKPANFPSELSFSFDKGAQSSKIIIRTFTVTDIYNNSTKCKQAIYVKRATLDRVSCPASMTVMCVSGYQNLNPRDTTVNGIAYKGTGEPKYSNGNTLMTGSCKILAGYSDRIFTYVNSGNKEIERTWTILNCCTGEKSECIQTLKVVDAKPTLTLKAGQKFDITTDKTVQVSDNQLISSVADDCTTKADLQLGMRKKGNGSGFPTVRNLTFKCLDKGKFIVEIWVKDGLGNTEIKDVEIEITDVNNNCNPIIPRIALSGSVTRENGDKITSLVTLFKDNDSITTQQTADFNFIDLPAGANYRLKPVRDNDIFNGVTTFDISIISRYLIGIDSSNISTPARMIAADVNADGEINGADMIHIRNLILRKASRFPNNNAWRFVSKNYVFLNPKAPFGEDFPEVLNYNNLTQSINQANFTAIKVGDVNGTAISNFTGTNTTTLNSRGSKPVLSIETEDVELKKGETKTLSFRLNDPSVSGLTAVQFALNFDKNKANITNLKQGEIANWTEANQNLIASEGILATAWSSGKATRFDKNQSVFSLAITAKEDTKLSEITRQNAAFTEGIAYDAAGNELGIQLIFNTLGIKEKTYKYSLLQNVPNPFTNETVIPFTMSKEDLATLTVFDATGKIVSTTQRTFAKGYNEVVFKTSNSSNAGVYYYRLQTGEFSAVKRMVLVK
jgi:hypothetical protein